MIDKWLNYLERNPNLYNTFRLIDVTEICDPDESILDLLGSELIDSYRNLDSLKKFYETESPEKLDKYIDDHIFPADKGLPHNIVKPGDFGEVLAATIVSYFQGLEVPIRKMRWKFNKDRSVFCTDMIAHNQGDMIHDIYYYEIKTRQSIQRDGGKHITVIAHNSLLYDQQVKNNNLADFLFRYHSEKENWDEAAKYHGIILKPETYHLHYELFFIIERDKFKEEILEDLHNLPPQLVPLNITVVLIDNFREKVDECYKRARKKAHQHVYE